MTKKLSVLFAFVALLFAQFALAQGFGVVTNLVGMANVQTGRDTPRALRMGDEVRQGDTISTGANSSVVLKFDDGEVAALTQNSRMTITAYQYEHTSGNGNILLSLVTGGMRAITGLLGHAHPDRVAYRAATATIGIRGTDVSWATDGQDVVVAVNSGTITLTVAGQKVEITGPATYYVHENRISSNPPPGFNPSLMTMGLVLGSLGPAMAQQELGSAQTSAGATATGATITNGSGGGGGVSVSVH
jgi:hypothetical protein